MKADAAAGAGSGSISSSISRFFHALPEAGFWVTHADDLDRIVLEGARLELAPSGEILRAAWADDRLERGDLVVGSIAVPAAEGGGFVHWTRSRILRSATFTGPLTLVATSGEGLRGVRAGLAGLVAITDTGPRALAPGSAGARSFAEPGVLDVVAASPTRAIRVDVFGRPAATFDGGLTWLDLAGSVGIAARSIGVEDGEIGVETWQGRFLVGPGGALASAEPAGYRAATNAFQTVWKGTRAGRAETLYGSRESSPLQAAVLAGAAVGDGTAFGVAESAIARVDLATGNIVNIVTDVLAAGLTCQPLRSGDDVLFACTWDRYQRAGGYVLRSRGGALPVVERAFTDAGSFLADDDGALAFTGSCAVTPRGMEVASDDARRFDGAMDTRTRPILCVRRAPARASDPPEWIERTVELAPAATLVAWVARRDGAASALVIGGEALPLPAGEPRAREVGGVRVIRVDRAASALRWTASRWGEGANNGGRILEKRFHARADGAIDAWLAPAEDGPGAVWLGVTLAADGALTTHALPPDVGAMQVTGAFGVAIARRGQLFETIDHGQTWRAAGASPLPPGSASTGGCSALGCVLGATVRLGWGEASGLAVSVAGEPEPPPPSAPSLPRITCAPAGAPRPEIALASLPTALTQAIVTPWGDTIDLGREATTPERAPPPTFGAPPPPPAAPTAPIATRATSAKPPRRAAAALAEKRTHTLQLRMPLAPFAAPSRLAVVAPGFTAQRRSPVTPLLGAAGEIELLFGGETIELRIAGAGAFPAPAFELRRYGGHLDGGGAAGLALGGGRSLVLGESHRRLALENHGASPLPPLFLGGDREPTRRRQMTLGRRDDGVQGVLVFDGAAPETVGVAPIDPAGAGVLALVKLAPWSTLTPASDPRCKAADPTAYRALVLLDPSTWLALDPPSLPGVSFAQKGLAEVRWGRSRVCLVALDAGVSDPRRRGDGARALRLVVRWDGAGEARGAAAPAPNGALRAGDLRQDLRCVVEPASTVEAAR
jgi:hypothetical protein